MLHVTITVRATTSRTDCKATLYGSTKIRFNAINYGIILFWYFSVRTCEMEQTDPDGRTVKSNFTCGERWRCPAGETVVVGDPEMKCGPDGRFIGSATYCETAGKYPSHPREGGGGGRPGPEVWTGWKVHSVPAIL